MSTRRSRNAALTLVALLTTGCPELEALAPVLDPGPSGGGGAIDDVCVDALALSENCERPAYVWRRPGGYWHPAAGMDPNWRPLAFLDPSPNRDPDPYVAGSAFSETIDHCGRQVWWEYQGRCSDPFHCETRGNYRARFDNGHRLLSIAYWWRRFILGPESDYRIAHTYDAQGARIATSGFSDNDPGPPSCVDGREFHDWDYGVGDFTYINDERGRLIEEIADVQDDHRNPEGRIDGIPDRRSEFTWDDEAGTVTEAIDEGADGVIDEVRVMPQPELR